jgi:2-dehydro-3-deoxygluconokinase
MTPDRAQANRRIAVIGECMIELSQDADGKLRQGFAGDTANTAVSLARLLPAPTATISYVTALGDDEFSAAMIGGWEVEGLDTALVRRLPGKLPGLYWISTDAAGERSFHYWRSESAARAMLSGGYLTRLRDALDGFELVCLSGITLAILPPGDREQLIGLLRSLRPAPVAAREWQPDRVRHELPPAAVAECVGCKRELPGNARSHQHRVF